MDSYVAELVNAVQPHYPKLLLAAIVLEVLGGLLFAFGSTLGAYMLVRVPRRHQPAARQHPCTARSRRRNVTHQTRQC